MMHEARYYKEHEQGVSCALCPKGCVIGEGKSGFCRVRKNIGGKLYSENYGACTSIALDPIEKKPLYHFYPGHTILSLGTWGCNFTCRFCQNWQIAHETPPTRNLSPQRAAELAMSYQDQQNVGIAFTYSEPGVWFEYVLDTAQEVRNKGLNNVLVTNGFLAKEPLQALLPYIDAMNIDVKAFNEAYYKDICAGTLEIVKNTVELAAGHCHVEITTLLVPGLNDHPEEIKELSRWLAAIRPDIPLHFSRYFPNYKMSEAATPLSVMQRSYDIAREHLQYVYLGNVGGQGGNTYCPQCGAEVINRLEGYSRLTGSNACSACGYIISIIGKAAF